MLIKFTRAAANRNGKTYYETPMVINSTYFIEANESNGNVWVKVWDRESNGPKSYQITGTLLSFYNENGNNPVPF